MVFLSLFSAEAQTNFFPKLMSSDGEVLLTNAEFRSVVGRKVIFRQRETRHLKAFDVSEIGSDARDVLKINVAEAIADQNKIDEEKANAAELRAAQVARVREQQRLRAIETAKRNAELAKLAAKRAEIAEQKRKEDELHRLDVQQRQADIDATRAEAARAKAAAGYLNRTP